MSSCRQAIARPTRPAGRGNSRCSPSWRTRSLEIHSRRAISLRVMRSSCMESRVTSTRLEWKTLFGPCPLGRDSTVRTRGRRPRHCCRRGRRRKPRSTRLRQPSCTARGRRERRCPRTRPRCRPDGTRLPALASRRRRRCVTTLAFASRTTILTWSKTTRVQSQSTLMRAEATRKELDRRTYVRIEHVFE